MAKYSIILICSNIGKKYIEHIENYLKKGIIVHLFCSDEGKKIIKNNSLCNEAIDKNLLFIYRNTLEDSNENLVIAIDNHIILKDLYDKLCKKSNSEFNSEQYEIITGKSDINYLVTAGAGTGKTTTMINRLIYLRKTEDDFSFEKISLITFTNKASKDIREKLINKLNGYFCITKDPQYIDMMKEISKSNISTIHKFAKKIINKYGKNIGINKEIEVKSLKFYRKEAIREGLDYVFHNRTDLYKLISKLPIYKIEDAFLRIWYILDNYSIDINSNFYNVDFGKEDSNFSELIKIVLIQAQGYMDSIKDNEFEVVDLMKKLKYKELFYNAKGEYKILMIDEFQDSDNTQIDFAVNFCNITKCKLFVVGDEKQSIYRFRGAEYTAFNQLSKKLKENGMKFKEYHLIRNYRTNANLLKEINNIFIKINNIVDKFTYNREDYIYSLNDVNKNSHINYLNFGYDDEKKVTFYKELLNKKDENENVAVLFRTNKEVKEFKKFCDRKKIPCHIDISGEFYRHEAVRDFYIMIRVLVDNSNDIMYSFIESPYIDFEIDKEKILTENTEAINNYLSNILADNGWDNYKKELNSKSILDLIDEIITNQDPVKNYYKKLSKHQEAYAKALEYKLNLEHLIYIINEEFSDSTSIFSIENFLKIKIATDNSVNVRKLPYKLEKGFLQCLTVHKSKGLEFDYVVMPKLNHNFNSNKMIKVILRNCKNKVKVGYKIVIDSNELKNDLFSAYFKDENSEIIGEETRLLYVALTRVKKGLYLITNGLMSTEGQNTWESLIGGAKSYV